MRIRYYDGETEYATLAYIEEDAHHLPSCKDELWFDLEDNPKHFRVHHIGRYYLTNSADQFGNPIVVGDDCFDVFMTPIKECF